MGNAADVVKVPGAQACLPNANMRMERRASIGVVSWKGNRF
jgi:hypothetical protein